MLIVSPRKLSTMTDVRMESGMEMAMISVLRQLPRKIRIIKPVRAGGNDGLTKHAIDRPAHENRLVEERVKSSHWVEAAFAVAEGCRARP